MWLTLSCVPNRRVLHCVDPSGGVRLSVHSRIRASNAGVSVLASWPACRLNSPAKRSSLNRLLQRSMKASLQSSLSRIAAHVWPASSSSISRARRASSARPLRLAARWLSSIRSASVSTIVCSMNTIILPFHLLHATSRLPPNNNSIPVAVKFVNASGNAISVYDRPEDASLLLGAIAGAISGNPKRPLQTVRIAKRPTIEIDLGSLAAAIEPQAATITATAAAAGLQVAPADTKIARVSTLLEWKGTPGSQLYIAFVDSDDSAFVTLVFLTGLADWSVR